MSPTPRRLPTVSALYAGSVSHVRLKPKRHRLRYRLFSLLLDLDELTSCDRALSLFSVNRANLFSLFERDYGAPCAGGLKAHIECLLAEAGLAPDGGPVRLLTMPRVLGYAFNPLSLFFCHRKDESLAAILYQVNNTFGQRHAYLIPLAKGEVAPFRQRAEKRFYVSPFLDMNLSYAFRIDPPTDNLRVGIIASDAEGPVLCAAQTGVRRPLNDRELLRAFLAYPLLTLKVIAGIHYEALRLWLKGIGLRPRPAPPERSVTLAPRNRS